MKAMKKNKFLTFCFSLIPGAGEMYMGFMKAGVSIMGLFFGLITFAGFLNMSILVWLIAVIWFYGFFHTNHLAGLSDEEFAKVEDEYWFGENLITKGKENIGKYRGWFAYVLIGFGVMLLWNTGIELLTSYLPDRLRDIVLNINYTLPQVVVAIVVIVVGIKMIQGKKKTLFEKESEQNPQWNGDGRDSKEV